MAKIAQESGVIRGILLHQGESGRAGTNGQNGSDNANWATAVKSIYDNLLDDLGLEADSVPLLAGQVVGNSSSIINSLPNTMPGVAYVIPSQGLSAAGPSGNDSLHFSYEGYRELGRRYAAKMLELLDYAQ
jgi:lysophospholipase L1-like esterase